jgi:transcriptional regulator with XRE-family HTH domain
MKFCKEEPVNRILREWLKKQREMQGLSLRDVGLRIERHHSIIGKVESGKRQITLVEFLFYCQTMGFNALEGIKLIEKEVSCLTTMAENNGQSRTTCLQ